MPRRSKPCDVQGCTRMTLTGGLCPQHKREAELQVSTTTRIVLESERA